MEILTHKGKLNIKIKAANVCNIQVVGDIILISANINSLFTVDRFKIYDFLNDYGFNSTKYITLLVGINEFGAINVNKCRVAWEECLLREEMPFHKSIKCKLNTEEKCFIISMFMPSNK